MSLKIIKFWPIKFYSIFYCFQVMAPFCISKLQFIKNYSTILTISIPSLFKFQARCQFSETCEIPSITTVFVKSFYIALGCLILLSKRIYLLLLLFPYRLSLVFSISARGHTPIFDGRLIDTVWQTVIPFLTKKTGCYRKEPINVRRTSARSTFIPLPAY